MHLLFDRFCQQLLLIVDQDSSINKHGIMEFKFPPIEPNTASPYDPFGLTPLQKTYLAHKLQSNDNRPTIVYKEFEIEGIFDELRFHAALIKLIKTHGVLHTVITTDGSQFVSLGVCFYPVAVHNLLNLPEEDKEDRLSSVRKEMSTRFFPSNTWPYFDIQVSQVAPNKTLVHIALDMIIVDGFGVFSFYHQLFCGYYDQTISLPRKYFCQSDYVRALDRANDEAQYNKCCDYWSKKVKSLPPGPLLHQISDGINTKVPLRITATCSWWSSLKERAVIMGIQPVSTLLAIYTEVIRIWAKQPQFSIVCVDYEHRRRLEASTYFLGDMTNLCWIASDAPTFMERVADINTQLYSDQCNSWVSGVEGFRIKTKEEGNIPLSFPVVFTNCLDLPHLPLPEPVKPTYGVSHTPFVLLDLFVYEENETLYCNWDYDSSSLMPEMVNGISGAFHQLADKLAVEQDLWQRQTLVPALSKSNLPAFFQNQNTSGSSPVPIKERLRQLLAWNHTDREYDRKVCLHELFEKQAERVPLNVATVMSGSALTYAELNSRANQLAHFLQKQGVGTNYLVGICLERSHEMIIAVMGILKAGGAYVPLNIVDPKDRIQAIAETAAIKIIISRLSLFEKVDIEGVRVIFTDGDESLIWKENAVQAPATGVTSDHLAYVIFTSGSTGTPKGVMVKHRPVVNLIEWVRKTFSFSERDRALFVSPLSFDLSVFDIFGLLSYGGSIRICTDEERLNAKELTHILCHEPISFWNSAPAAFQLLMPYLSSRKAIFNQNLRLVFFSGDWIPLSLPDEVRKGFPQAQVISLGGATEATVWSNYYPVDHIDPSWKSIPYGRPIQNARYYILDAAQQPCAIGEDGDLFIGGECLSEGYINDPLLTAEKFLPDPFHERPGFKMYKTGDLARFFPDGNIKFLGRADHQVKVRGYRIELGEIDAALQKAGIVEAVTVLREETPRNKVLVAFVASNAQEMKDEEVVKQALRSMLPEYMIPSKIVFLSALPLTDNGKVDRKILSAGSYEDVEANFGRAKEELKSKDSDHRQAAEKRLKECIDQFIRSEVARMLQRKEEQIDLLSNIGHLGFNSLHYTMLSAGLSETLGNYVNPTDFFRHNTVDKISNFLLGKYEQELARYFHHEYKEMETEVSAVVEPQAPYYCTKPSQEPVNLPEYTQRPEREEDIAVIGMWGTMPQADDLYTFWQNLVKEKDSVVEVPLDRWDWKAIYGDPLKENNKTLSNKGGFIREVDKFDASFFGISPREAELMDPRQRMLLENVWHCLEDAGYSASSLAGSPVGVFIGATGDEYANICLNKAPAIDNFTLSGISRTILANRISYFFNWSGPSEVVDTACSASLVAIHNAVKALHSGDCSLAIAGGINIMIDPTPHICLSKIGMLSPDSTCKAFDASANGYVRGEGLGTVVLKGLKKAVEDGDFIYAVIKATTINHGGKANALTAPNPQAQIDLLLCAYRKANIDPITVTYIETHGTGTSLGDPIEVAALKDAFGKLYREAGGAISARTGLGSVKTNIGHLEAAAGIAGFLKCVLALRYKKIPASLHLRQLNPRIELAGTPFYIVDHTRNLEVVTDTQGLPLPCRVGISSFGFGGVNAHIVLEEYTESPVQGAGNEPALLVLSAKDEDRLKIVAQNLLDFLEDQKDSVALRDLTYTLFSGREPLEERAAWVVQNIRQCTEVLRAFTRGSAGPVYRGNVKKDKDILHLLDGGEGQRFLQTVFLEKKLDKIAQLWVWGVPVEPAGLFKERRYHRIPLPVYPFRKERHWPVFLERKELHRPGPATKEGETVPESSGIILKGNEYFFDQHIIQGKKMLPGMAYVAFVCRAYEEKYGQPLKRLTDITWLHPLVFEKDRPVSLNICFEEKRGQIVTTCVTAANHKQQMHFMATAGNPAEKPCLPEVEKQKMIRQLGRAQSSDTCYRQLEEHGINYGETFRVIRNYWVYEDQAVAQLALGTTNETAAQVPVTLLDGALQAIVLRQLFVQPDKDISVPYNIDQLCIYELPDRECYVYIKAAYPSGQLEKTDIFIIDKEGRVFVSILGSSARAILGAEKKLRDQPVHFYSEEWKKVWMYQSIETARAHPGILIVNDAPLAHLLRQEHFQVSEAFHADEGAAHCTQDKWVVNFNSYLQVKQLVQTLTAAGSFPDMIIFRMGLNGTQDLKEQIGRVYFQFSQLCKILVKLALKKAVRIFVVFPQEEEDEFGSAVIRSLSSFGKSLHKENPALSFKFLEVGTSLLQNTAGLAAKIAAVSITPEDLDMWRCLNAETEFLEYRTISPRPAPDPLSTSFSFRSDGSYLITGGTGKIGWLLGKHLADAFSCRVILVGRSLSVGQAESIKQWNEQGRQIVYYPCDVSNKEQVQGLIAGIEEQFGLLSGIFHCAGSLQDSLLINKKKEQVEKVFAGKVQGLINFHAATLKHPLEFFVLFSSLTAVTGNVGQTDYTYANRLLTELAACRNRLVAAQKCSGVTVSISWPLWEEGGMQVPPSMLARIREQTGIEPLQTQTAFKTLQQCIRARQGHYIPVSGNRRKIDQLLVPNVALSATEDLPNQQPS